MKMTAKIFVLALVTGMLMIAATWPGLATAGVRVEFAYRSAPADIRVWLGSGAHYDSYRDDYDDYADGLYEYDVYPSAQDVVLYVRASRNCYATVYVVDTGGYLHVVHPLSPYDETYIHGGRVYRFVLSDYGFCDGFDRGVAFAYAVSSPVPFSYATYGLDIFGDHFGFHIYGDPYVASHEFYSSLLGRCDLGLIGVSHARFYVREYVRYPSYLCVGWHDYHNTRTYCRNDCAAYRYYRVHSRDPYRVLHPKHRLKRELRAYSRVARAKRTRIREVLDGSAYKSPRVRAHVKSDVRRHSGGTRDRAVYKARTAPKTRAHTGSKQFARVVKSHRGSFVKGKSDITTMRKQLRDERVSKKTHRVTGAGHKRPARGTNESMRSGGKHSRRVTGAVKNNSPRAGKSKKGSSKRSTKERSAAGGKHRGR